jgi:hypothetical protein
VTDTTPEPHHPTAATVEEVVRGQLAKALGGRRGMLEAAVPTVIFTVVFLVTKELRLALPASVAVALVLLVVRLVQRSTVQFVLNAIFGIGLGWLFVYLAARGGGDKSDQALAYFLPGLLYNTFYSVLIALTCLIGWPLIGFMIGSVTGDPTAWHEDRAVVRLCTRLTWVLAVPCLVRVVVQGPIWLSAHAGSLDTDTAIAALGTLKIVMGWPLQLATLAGMVWLLARNSTPLEPQRSAE